VSGGRWPEEWPVAGDQLMIYGPGYSFTSKGPNGAVMNWHEAAQAYLESARLRAANASLVYSLAAVGFALVLLWLLWRKRIFPKV